MCSQNRDARVEALATFLLEPLVKMLDAVNVQTRGAPAARVHGAARAHEARGVVEKFIAS